MPQSLAKIYIHAVFSTKNREPILLDRWRNELFSVLGGAVNHLGCQSLHVSGIADHVHLLFQQARTLSIADAIGRIKTASSIWVNEIQRPHAHFHWQGGYAAFSVSQSQIEPVREYIRNQPEHHKTQTFQEELRNWLQRYEISWDERYVWD